MKERAIDKALLLELLFMLVLAFLGLYDGIRLSRVSLLNPDPVGPGWYLFIVSGMLFLCALWYCFIPKNQKKRIARAEKKVPPFSIGSAGWVLIVLVVYTIVTPLVGYTPATAFFFVLALRFSGVNSWPKSIVLGLAFAAAFKFLFSDLAGISLP